MVLGRYLMVGYLDAKGYIPRTYGNYSSVIGSR